jgi:hypothetical protein
MQVQALLDEFFEQCFIEQSADMGSRSYFMPTSVHLLVQQQFANGATQPPATHEALSSTVSGIDLAGAPYRLVLHFVALLRDVARGVASDKGKGGKGLEVAFLFGISDYGISALL